MTATINAAAKGINTNHRREKGFHTSYIVLSIAPDAVTEAVDLRIYYGASRCYACLWVRDTNDYRHGSGTADGYGYHKPSAAAYEAITRAGYALNEGINACGDGAIRAALMAIAELHCPGARLHMVEAHG